MNVDTEFWWSENDKIKSDVPEDNRVQVSLYFT